MMILLCVLKKIGKEFLGLLWDASTFLGILVMLAACVAIPFFAAVAIMMLSTGFSIDVSARAVGLLVVVLLLWLCIALLIQGLLIELKVIVKECKSNQEGEGKEWIYK
jgi:hypothetical protein